MYVKKQPTIEEYIFDKLNMLTRDFQLGLEPSEFNRILTAKNEIQVDNIAKSILKNALSSGQV